MYALRAHINKSIFGKVLLGIEKVVKTFLISDKLFSKLDYYCVPLGHTLVKSLLLNCCLYTIYRFWSSFISQLVVMHFSTK